MTHEEELEQFLSQDPKRYFYYSSYKEVLFTLQDVFWCACISYKLSDCGKFLYSDHSQSGNRYEIHSRGILNNDFKLTEAGGNSTIKVINPSTDRSLYISQKHVGGLTHKVKKVLQGKTRYKTVNTCEMTKFKNIVIYSYLHDSDFAFDQVNWEVLNLAQKLEYQNNLAKRKKRDKEQISVINEKLQKQNMGL